MIFHVPDLQRYQDSRGWLFDFEPTAPGPARDDDRRGGRTLCSDLTGVRERYAAAYQKFHDDYLDLDDGRAGAATRGCCLRAPRRRMTHFGRATCTAPDDRRRLARCLLPIGGSSSSWGPGAAAPARWRGPWRSAGSTSRIRSRPRSPTRLASSSRAGWSTSTIELLEPAGVRTLDSDPDAPDAGRACSRTTMRARQLRDVAGAQPGRAPAAGDQGSAAGLVPRPVGRTSPRSSGEAPAFVIMLRHPSEVSSSRTELLQRREATAASPAGSTSR